ncbi:Hypothetical predicted protein [Cloeon dipterum]|uniref:AB hydrolase-1 domain-containing protein n=1 Tax=Cloeon dipterum TaxID=197152 RepID=A0A8S1BTU4_9INSE|nr:Hypothetical predicted protein [Cloeon dipterum]
MSTVILAVVAVILCVLFRILNVNSEPTKPVVFCKDRNFFESILKMAPLLNEPYQPTRLWGFSGHVQTVVHSIIGRVRCPLPIGERCLVNLTDGSTLTYDVYEPLEAKNIQPEDDFTLAICPGIGNTSESVYIRTFVHHATHQGGYRCAVLNHVGALTSVQVTAPRLFTYGHTDDFDMMLKQILERWPNTRIIAVGFSLGGNLVTKYFGEQRIRPSALLGAISVCQGYCALEGTKWLLMWHNFRRFYLYFMTENMKSIILRHRKVLLSEDVRKKHKLNERDIFSAATLPELDEAYTRRVHNFGSVRELYQWSSSVNYLKDIRSPMIFINAKDDPLVPEPMLSPVRNLASMKKQVLHLELAHGGHLGFYEGGLLYPNPVTWLDRALVALTAGIIQTSLKT